jgi:hypothetical protein
MRKKIIIKPELCISGTFDEECNGKGKIEYIDNSVYQGQILNWVPHGSGIMKNPNGSKFEGTWVAGTKDYGSYTTETGNIIEGKWENDEIKDTGTFYFTNGKIYKGQMEKNEANGIGYLIENSHTFHQGYWENNKLTDLYETVTI